MKIVVYSSDQMDGKHIREVFENMFADVPLVCCDNLQDLSRWLNGPAYESPVAVLFAADNEELVHFLNLKEQLSFAKLILIAPDEDEITLTNAHKLRPRFLSFSRSDLSDVLSVLTKMIRDNAQSPEVTRNNL